MTTTTANMASKEALLVKELTLKIEGLTADLEAAKQDANMKRSWQTEALESRKTILELSAKVREMSEAVAEGRKSPATASAYDAPPVSVEEAHRLALFCGAMRRFYSTIEILQGGEDVVALRNRSISTDLGKIHAILLDLAAKADADET